MGRKTFALFFIVGLLSTLPLSRILAYQSDLGCSTVSDTTVRTHSQQQKPDYLQSYFDPVYNAKITRICGDPGTPIVYQDGSTSGTWGQICRHEYSKQQSWNADQSIIWLQFSGLALDGATYKPIKLNKPSYSHEYPRWHPTNPDLMAYTYYNGSTNEVGYWNIRTKTKTLTKTFEGYEKLYFGPGEGNLSYDGSMVALFSKKTMKAFAYNLATQTKYEDINLSAYIDASASEPIDWVSISASGQYVVVNIHNPNDNSIDTTRVFDIHGNQVGPYWSQKSCPSHYDLTIDTDGSDVAVGVCKQANELITTYGTIKRRLSDGAITMLGNKTQSDHTSTRNIGRTGFAYTSRPWGNAVYTNEILSLKLDGSIVERLAWFPNTLTDYNTEPHAVPAPNGKKILISGNWGEESGRPVQAYVVELCSNTDTQPTNPVPTATPTKIPNTTETPSSTPTRSPTLTSVPTTPVIFSYSAWLSNYGKIAKGPTNGDFNNDNKVDGVDYVLWLIKQ